MNHGAHGNTSWRTRGPVCQGLGPGAMAWLNAAGSTVIHHPLTLPLLSDYGQIWIGWIGGASALVGLDVFLDWSGLAWYLFLDLKRSALPAEPPNLNISEKQKRSCFVRPLISKTKCSKQFAYPKESKNKNKLLSLKLPKIDSQKEIANKCCALKLPQIDISENITMLLFP